MSVGILEVTIYRFRGSMNHEQKTSEIEFTYEISLDDDTGLELIIEAHVFWDSEPTWSGEVKNVYMFNWFARRADNLEIFPKVLIPESDKKMIEFEVEKIINS